MQSGSLTIDWAMSSLSAGLEGRYKQIAPMARGGHDPPCTVAEEARVEEGEGDAKREREREKERDGERSCW